MGDSGSQRSADLAGSGIKSLLIWGAPLAAMGG